MCVCAKSQYWCQGSCEFTLKPRVSYKIVSILQTDMHHPCPSYKQIYHSHWLVWSCGVTDSTLSSPRHVFSKALQPLIAWQGAGACRALSRRSPASYHRVAPTTLFPGATCSLPRSVLFPSGSGSTSLTIFGCSRPGA